MAKIELHTLYPSPDKYEQEFDRDFFISMLRNPELDDLTLIKIGELSKARVSWDEGLVAVLRNVQNHKNLNEKVLEQVFPVPFIFNVISHKSNYLFVLLVESYVKFSIPIIYRREVLEEA